jgi:TRAP-type transport system periplasmic protein
MKKRSLIVLGIVVCALLLNGCNKTTTGTEDSAKSTESKIVLKLSSCLPTDDRSHAYLKKACDEIKEKTNGVVEIQFYPNAQLGGLKDNMEQIVRGADIIAYADPGYISKYVPDIGVLTGPYLYNNYNDIAKITSSDWYKNDL